MWTMRDKEQEGKQIYNNILFSYSYFWFSGNWKKWDKSLRYTDMNKCTHGQAFYCFPYLWVTKRHFFSQYKCFCKAINVFIMLRLHVKWGNFNLPSVIIKTWSLFFYYSQTFCRKHSINTVSQQSLYSPHVGHHHDQENHVDATCVLESHVNDPSLVQ